MGHHDIHPSYNHREMLMVQHRTETFLLLFSVSAIALVLFTASIQMREATCQSRASVGVHSVYIRSGAGNASIIPIITGALRKKGVEMIAYVREGAGDSQIDVFDTSEQTLKNEGFVLLRRTQEGTRGGTLHWQLRYLDRSLCTTHRERSMEALPNVDYERVKYTVRAIEANGKNAFLYIANVKTEDRNKVKTFQQLQTLFPGFQSIVASPLLVTQKSIKSVRWYKALLYYGGRPLDIEMLVEQRKETGRKVDSWRIALSSKNPLLEFFLEHVASIVTQAAKENGLFCDKDVCGKFSDDVLLE